MQLSKTIIKFRVKTCFCCDFVVDSWSVYSLHLCFSLPQVCAIYKVLKIVISNWWERKSYCESLVWRECVWKCVGFPQILQVPHKVQNCPKMHVPVKWRFLNESLVCACVCPVMLQSGYYDGSTHPTKPVVTFRHVSGLQGRVTSKLTDQQGHTFTWELLVVMSSSDLCCVQRGANWAPWGELHKLRNKVQMSLKKSVWPYAEAYNLVVGRERSKSPNSYTFPALKSLINKEKDMNIKASFYPLNPNVTGNGCQPFYVEL